MTGVLEAIRNPLVNIQTTDVTYALYERGEKSEHSQKPYIEVYITGSDLPVLQLVGGDTEVADILSQLDFGDKAVLEECLERASTTAIRLSKNSPYGIGVFYPDGPTGERLLDPALACAMF